LPGTGGVPKWLVDRVVNIGFVKRKMLDDREGQALLRHAYEEFHCLASFLPALFEQEAASHWKTVAASGL